MCKFHFFQLPAVPGENYTLSFPQDRHLGASAASERVDSWQVCGVCFQDTGHGGGGVTKQFYRGWELARGWCVGLDSCIWGLGGVRSRVQDVVNRGVVGGEMMHLTLGSTHCLVLCRW